MENFIQKQIDNCQAYLDRLNNEPYIMIAEKISKIDTHLENDFVNDIIKENLEALKILLTDTPEEWISKRKVETQTQIDSLRSNL